MLRKAVFALLLALSCMGFCQTQDDNDLIYGAGILNIKVQRLLDGDPTDRSAEFPKSKAGQWMLGIYQVMLRQVIRDAHIAREVFRTGYLGLLSGEFYHMPKEGIREVGKVAVLFSRARVAYLADMKVLDTLVEPSDADSTSMRAFKTGMKDGFVKSKQQVRDRDAYTLNLIWLSRVEEALHFQAQNPGAVTDDMGVLAFKDKILQVTWQQKLDAVQKASKALANYDIMRAKKIKDFKSSPLTTPAISG